MGLFIEKSKSLDVNQTSVGTTDTDDFAEAKTFSLQVTMASGSFGSATLAFQCTNGTATAWVAIQDRARAADVTISTTGLFTDIESFAAKHCRLIPTTAGGTAGVVTIIMVGKD